jgi:UDP-N-acetylglucosamine 2-epimerase (non-hydrolysing)
MKIGIVLGTRPQIIKMAPVIAELEQRGWDYFGIDTGQHATAAMRANIYADLNMAPCDYMLTDYEYGRTAAETREILALERPDQVHVHGDTDSTMIGAMAAASLGIPIAHHEAGLRAGTLWMREEQNRVVADHLAADLYAPTQQAEQNLIAEGCRGKTTVTGNLIADVLARYWKPAPAGRDYILLTLHRAENVDNPKRLASILIGVLSLRKTLNLDVIWPVHPRAKAMLERHRLDTTSIEQQEPAGFLQFLGLESSAQLILTDSGGVQEEACIMGVPCVTLRDSTERPETVELGANALAGADPRQIVKQAQKMIGKTGWRHPYGDGRSAKMTLDLIQ